MLTTVGCAPPAPRLQTSGLEALRSTVTVGLPLGATVSYVRSAQAGDTTVIWVHGTPGELNGWSDYVLDPIAGTVSIALDRPGFGFSNPQKPITRLEQQAAAVVALLPAAPQRAVLVGHSLGGAVVAWVAAQHPDRVRAVVLLASALDPGQETIHPMQYFARIWPLSALLPSALRNANEELMAFKSELLALEPLLPFITAPTIIVHGTKDELVPFENVAYMQSHLTGVKCIKTEVLEGQNHFLPWNSESTVRDAVRWALSQGGPQAAPC